MYPVLKHRFSSRYGLPSRWIPLYVMLMVAYGSIHAAQEDTKVVEVHLGSYQFTPHNIQLIEDQAVILRLINTDSIIPHNFTIEDASGELDMTVDIMAGDTVDINLKPSTVGEYTFYCGNKLLFMKSHREQGMEGTLQVVPRPD